MMDAEGLSETPVHVC